MDEVSQSRVFFPLRSNVELFQTPAGYLTLLERLKVASLLFDSVILEGGLYKLQMTEAGALDVRLRRERDGKGLTDQTAGEMRRQFEGLTQLESPSFRVYAQPSDGSGEPKFLFGGPTIAFYFSEFQSIVSDLGSVQAPWLVWVDDDFVRMAEPSQLIDQLCHDDYHASVGAEIPDERIRSHLIKSLNTDLVFSSVLDAMLSTDPIHAHLMSAKLERQGYLALPRMAVVNTYLPSVRDVPWDEINDLRSDPGIKQFRQVVGEIEQQLMDLPHNAPVEEVRRYIQIEWNKQMAEVLAESRSSIRQIAFDTTKSVVLDLIPIPLLGSITGLVEDLIQVRSARNSWLSVFMRLHQ